jgi:hypothetical protein
MKLIAAKDFFNSKKLGIVLDKKADGFKHENHLHTGARVEIGKSENFEDLGAEDKEHVGMLLKHGLAILDNKENAENGVIKKIDASAAAATKMDKAASATPPSIVDVMATIAKQNADILAGLTALTTALAAKK